MGKTRDAPGSTRDTENDGWLCTRNKKKISPTLPKAPGARRSLPRPVPRSPLITLLDDAPCQLTLPTKQTTIGDFFSNRLKPLPEQGGIGATATTAAGDCASSNPSDNREEEQLSDNIDYADFEMPAPTPSQSASTVGSSSSSSCQLVGVSYVKPLSSVTSWQQPQRPSLTTGERSTDEIDGTAPRNLQTSQLFKEHTTLPPPIRVKDAGVCSLDQQFLSEQQPLVSSNTGTEAVLSLGSLPSEMAYSDSLQTPAFLKRRSGTDTDVENNAMLTESQDLKEDAGDTVTTTKRTRVSLRSTASNSSDNEDASTSKRLRVHTSQSEDSSDQDVSDSVPYKLKQQTSCGLSSNLNSIKFTDSQESDSYNLMSTKEKSPLNSPKSEVSDYLRHVESTKEKSSLEMEGNSPKSESDSYNAETTKEQSSLEMNWNACTSSLESEENEFNDSLSTPDFRDAETDTTLTPSSSQALSTSLDATVQKKAGGRTGSPYKSKKSLSLRSKIFQSKISKKDFFEDDLQTPAFLKEASADSDDLE